MSQEENSFFNEGVQVVDANAEETRAALAGLEEEESSEPSAEDVLNASSDEEQGNEEKEEEEIKPKEKEDPLSKKFAALSRREKQVRQRERELESRIAQLEKQTKAPQEQIAQVEPELDISDLLKKNPLEALKKHGYDINKLAEIALNDGKLPVELQMQIMREELESSYKKEIEEIKKQLESKDEAERERKDSKIIEDYKNNISSFVQENTEKYEYIVATGNEELVYDTILQYHDETGVEMQFEEAADLVESYLESEAQKVFEKTKKAKRIFGTPEAKQEQKTQSKATSPTLTNDASGTVPTSKKQMMSDEDSLREAAKLLRWSE